jgi:hypothetical protein
MWEGRDGWDFFPISYKDGRKFHLVCMTTQKHRPYGHIGLAITDVYGDDWLMAHASSRFGFTTMVMSEKWANRWKIGFKNTTGESGPRW